MTQDEARQLLSDAEVIPCLEARVEEAKEILSVCLDAELPALLDRGACCGKAGCGCAPKLELLVRPEDLPRVTALLDARWAGMLEREGTVEESAPRKDGEEPCPACGTAAPLVEGACSDCGLQLE